MTGWEKVLIILKLIETLIICSGVYYIAYLVIKALNKYIGS